MKRWLALSLLALIPATCLFAPSAANSESFYKKYANIEKVGTSTEACKEFFMAKKLLLHWVRRTKDYSLDWKSLELKLLRELAADKGFVVYKHMGITYEMVIRNFEEDTRKTSDIAISYCNSLVEENTY